MHVYECWKVSVQAFMRSTQCGVVNSVVIPEFSTTTVQSVSIDLYTSISNPEFPKAFPTMSPEGSHSINKKILK